MANHKSALKRARQSDKRRLRNQDIRSRVRTFVKKFRAALEAGDAAEAQKSFREAEREIRRASTKGVIPARRADRSVSRLARSLNGVASS